MTSVSINKVGQDQVVLELMQTGSSETSVNLRNNLLDDSLNYMFTVDSLSVPLNSAPISPVTSLTELFRVSRRMVGLPVGVYDTVFNSTYNVTPGNKLYDVSSFARDLSNWARGFNREQSLAGIEEIRQYGGQWDADSELDAMVGNLEYSPALTQNQVETGQTYNFLQVQVTPDGKIQITGTPRFHNSFYFVFSTYGAALLGLSDTVLPGGVLGYIAPQPGIPLHVGVTNPNTNLITHGNFGHEVLTVGDHPLWQSADQRIKVTVSSHLPISSNLSVVDQKETVSREISESFFESKLETAIRFDDSGQFQDITVKSKLYSGQVSFVKKSDLHTEWHKLDSAAFLRYYRFYVWIWYRSWTGVAWQLVRKPLDIPKDKYWSMSLRFVSES